MHTTIKDIAKALNLNFSSVSRALNNKAGVSVKTRQIVLQKAQEMGYQPNILARGLVSRSTNTIGVIMPDILNPVFSAITTSVIETANSNDYDVFTCITNWDADREKEYIRTLLEKQVDGIIIKTVNNASSRLLCSSSVPVIGFESSESPLLFSSVCTDNERAGYIAGEHLLRCGYINTAVLPGPGNSSAASDRSRGFFSACNDHGRQCNRDRIVYGDYNIKSGYELASVVMKDFPEIDSILAGNDVIALGVLQYLEENSISPGKDVGVIGFDNITYAGLPQIRLTTVKQQKHRIGKIMTNLLFEEINSKESDNRNPPRRILLEPELIIRDTTCMVNNK